MSQFEEIGDPGDVVEDDELLFRIDNINKSFSYTMAEQNMINSNNYPIDEEKVNKKRVRFAPETIFYNEHNICLSIINHEYNKDVGHTVYTIKVRMKQI